MNHMMRNVTILVGSVLLAGLAVAQEKQIKRSELPPAVEHALALQLQNATLRGLSSEHEHGQTFYEAALLVNGHRQDVLMDATGAIVEIETEVTLDSLPAAVKSGLAAKAGAGKIVSVESLTKHDRLVAYEAQVQTGGKRSEIQVGPDGKPLKREE